MINIPIDDETKSIAMWKCAPACPVVVSREKKKRETQSFYSIKVSEFR